MHVSAVEEQDGVLRVAVYDPESGKQPIALLACVASPRGLAALREAGRVILEPLNGATAETGHAFALDSAG